MARASNGRLTSVPRRGVGWSVITCVLGFLLLMTSACSESGNEEATSSASTPTWTAPLPDVAPLSLDEALDIIQSDPRNGPQFLDVGEIPAAVFNIGQGQLDVTHPEWMRLVDMVCGPEGLADEAIAAGWTVLVTGYVDSSGAHGPRSINDRLQEERASNASRELSAACQIPLENVETAKGGIAGDGPEARKVTVSYVRHASGDESS